MNNLNTPNKEQVATKVHEIWAHWMSYLFSCGTFQEDGSLKIGQEFIERWQCQIETPYHELSEEEKKSDREQSKKILDLYKNHLSKNQDSLKKSIPCFIVVQLFYSQKPSPWLVLLHKTPVLSYILRPILRSYLRLTLAKPLITSSQVVDVCLSENGEFGEEQLNKLEEDAFNAFVPIFMKEHHYSEKEKKNFFVSILVLQPINI